jgi:hypothetical protein
VDAYIIVCKIDKSRRLRYVLRFVCKCFYSIVIATMINYTDIYIIFKWLLYYYVHISIYKCENEICHKIFFETTHPIISIFFFFLMKEYMMKQVFKFYKSAVLNLFIFTYHLTSLPFFFMYRKCTRYFTCMEFYFTRNWKQYTYKYLTHKIKIKYFPLLLLLL